MWGGGFGHVHLGYIKFSQNLLRVLGQEETLPWACQCNKLHSTICIVLLSEFVSWNAWLQEQHSRLPCPSLSPGICSNSCPLRWRCHPTVSFSVAPFSSCSQSFPASGSFPSWDYYLTHLCLSFFICKVGTYWFLPQRCGWIKCQNL